MKLKYSLVIGDSFFWDTHWKSRGCEGYIRVQRKIKEPNVQLLGPLGPNSVPLKPSLSWMVRGQGRDDADTEDI